MQLIVLWSPTDMLVMLSELMAEAELTKNYLKPLNKSCGSPRQDKKIAFFFVTVQFVLLYLIC